MKRSRERKRDHGLGRKEVNPVYENRKQIQGLRLKHLSKDNLSEKSARAVRVLRPSGAFQRGVQKMQ